MTATTIKLTIDVELSVTMVNSRSVREGLLMAGIREPPKSLTSPVDPHLGYLAQEYWVLWAVAFGRTPTAVHSGGILVIMVSGFKPPPGSCKGICQIGWDINVHSDLSLHINKSTVDDEMSDSKDEAIKNLIKY